MEPEQSVTLWFDQLRKGNEQAASQLWQRYFQRLVQLAKQRLGATPNRLVDEEDVAVSVFHAICRGAAKGHFPDISNRDDLWRILLTSTKRKVIDHLRHVNREKRGGGAVHSESVFMNADEEGGLDAFAEDQPTPELLAEMEENLQHLLSLLRDDSLRQIAIQRMEGHSNKEIAESMGVTPRTIERKLNLIRVDWSQAVGEG